MNVENLIDDLGDPAFSTVVEEVPGSISRETISGNEVFEIGPGLSVLNTHSTGNFLVWNRTITRLSCFYAIFLMN